MIRLLTFIIFFALYSCSNDYGNKIVGGELSVYYMEGASIKKAEEIALYWKENNLLTGNKQDMQLEKVKDAYILKLIQTNDVKGVNMSFNERKLLYDLQKDIREKIFSNESFSLALANNKFEITYKIEE